MAAHRLTLMAVHAHPDDEATGTGGTLAQYAAQGVRTVLVTCTDGRCGDGPGGVKPGEPGHDPQAVVDLRRGELERSCAVLGVTDLEMLGYADSGMMGWPTNDAPGAFWTTPVDAAATRLAELMAHYRPDVVVTYDPNGFYGHPDHIQAHRITMAALDSYDGVAKAYWTTVPRSAMARFGEVMRELGADWEPPGDDAHDPSDGPGAGDDGPGFQVGLPDDEITSWIDIRDHAAQKYDALEAHASQSENIFFLRMGKERFAELMGVETYVRVRDTTDAPVPEADLFAGLR